jgi:glycosyltransferase involved in cell wall biosynthesis
MISVILSFFNSQDTLALSIQSVLDQSYSDIELILIDDFSSDNSYEIANYFAKRDSRIFLMKNNSNLGLARSLNLAIHQSRFPYIARIDADDICYPDRLAMQFNFLRDNPEIDILGSNAVLIDEAGMKVGQTDIPLAHDEILSAIRYRNPLIHPTVIMKRDVFKGLNGYDEKLRKAQDLDLWQRAVTSGYVFRNLSNCLIMYRQVLQKPTATILKGFKISFLYALKNRSLVGLVLSIVDLVKYFLIKIGLYEPRVRRKNR